MSRSRAVRRWCVALAAVGVVAAACSSSPSTAPEEVQARARGLIDDYGCGTCHTIPGVRGADGLVGPPLTAYSQRTWVAGQRDLPNNLDNLTRWIMNPREHDPDTDMPDLGVSEDEARTIARYLAGLQP